MYLRKHITEIVLTTTVIENLIKKSKKNMKFINKIKKFKKISSVVRSRIEIKT